MEVGRTAHTRGHGPMEPECRLEIPCRYALVRLERVPGFFDATQIMTNSGNASEARRTLRRRYEVMISRIIVVITEYHEA